MKNPDAVTQHILQRRQAELEDTNTYVHPTQRGSYVRDALTLSKWPKIDVSDPDAINQRIDEYVDFCESHNAVPTLSGLALVLGTDRRTLWRWETGELRTPAHRDAIKRAHVLIEESINRLLMEGKMNPAAGIFMLKNWYGYKDNVDINVTPVTSMAESLPAERIEAQLKDLPDE